MDLLKSPKWRAQRRTYKPVDCELVQSRCDSYVEALQVYGRSDLADALESRVDENLVGKFGGLLEVLRELASRDLDRALPDLRRKDYTSWDEIVAEEPLSGEHWDEPLYVSEPSSPHSDSDYKQETVSFEPDAVDFGEPEPVRAWEPVKVPALLPVLSDADLIMEIRYALLGYSTRFVAGGALTSTTMCNASLKGVVHSVVRYQGLMDRIRLLSVEDASSNFVFAQVHQHLCERIDRLKSKTVLQFVAALSSLLSPYFSLASADDYYDALRNVPTNSALYSVLLRPLAEELSQWVSRGAPGILLSDYPRDLADLLNPAFELNLPSFLPTDNVLTAGRYGYFCREMFKHDLPVVPLDIGADLDKQILFILMRNSDCLFSHLRPALERAWTTYCDVFIAQDARMLMFLSECMEKNLDFFSPNVQALSQAKAVLAKVWPDCPFSLGSNFYPVIEESNPLIRLLIPLTELQLTWHKIVRVMSLGSQDAIFVELECAKLAKNGFKYVHEMSSLDPIPVDYV